MYDFIVIGGGPAGLTAAIYAIRKRLNVLLISEDLGGKTNYHLDLPDVENYQVIRGRGGGQPVSRVNWNTWTLPGSWSGSTKVEKRATGSLSIPKDGAALDARAVIVASGTQRGMAGRAG